MKKVFHLLICFLLMFCLKTRALECKDYLDYVTTTDTIAYTNSPQTYDIKVGTEFKMCHQAGTESIVKFSDGTIAAGIKEGTYRLKEAFNMDLAHPMEDNQYILNDDADVFSDPSAISKIGNVSKDTEVDATYYYGPFVYITDSSTTGWVYIEYLSKVDSDEVTTDSEVKNEKEVDIKNDNSNNINNNNNSWEIAVIGGMALIIILIGAFIFIKKKNNRSL